MIHILVLKAWFILWVKLARDSFRLSAISPGSWPLFAPFYGVLTPSLARVLDERCFGVLICLFFMVFACLVLLLLARVRLSWGPSFPEGFSVSLAWDLRGSLVPKTFL